MSQSSKFQAYPYSMRTVLGVTDFCTDRTMFYIVPPEDAITIENLFLHFVLLFDAGIAVADRMVKEIGISDEFVSLGSVAGYSRNYTLNQAADVNRRVDISIDLTALLNKDNVGYREDILDAGDPTTGYTYIEVKLPESLRDTVVVGTVEMWKVDALFTTQGVR